MDESHQAPVQAMRCSLHRDSDQPTSSAKGDLPGIRQRAKELMVANGRCKHQVDHLSNIYGRKALAYLAALPVLPCRLRDHTPCSSRDACVAYHTDSARYQVQHVNPECRCQMISTPDKELVQVIRNGQIPLLSIEGASGASTTPKLRVHVRKTKSKYVAISHVWADGLGNPGANALPSCQIGQLRSRLEALSRLLGYFRARSPVLFWMDTLCIPVAQTCSSLRLLQIDKMGSIYRGAASTLVLDAELMTMPIDVAHFTHTWGTFNDESGYETHSDNHTVLSTALQARIASSIWMTRSWTLQEGQLCSCLAVQFLDHAAILENDKAGTRSTDLICGDCPRKTVSEKAAMRNDGHEGGVTFPNDSCVDCARIELRRNFSSTFSRGTGDIVSVWNELSGRSTTMPVDLPIIVANLLDFRYKEIMECQHPAEILQLIILSLNNLPMSILFNTGPRQTAREFRQNRWVPLEISKEQLRGSSWLRVYPTHLLYRVGDEDNSGISIYILNKILNLHLKSRVHLFVKDEDVHYVLDSLDLTADHPSSGGFSSTCIIIENAGLIGSPKTKRGACFYVRDHASTPSSNTHSKRYHGTARLKSENAPEIDMMFICPLRLEKVSKSEAAEHMQLTKYELVSLEKPSRLRIGYGWSEQIFFDALAANLWIDAPTEFKRLVPRTRVDQRFEDFRGAVTLLIFLFCLSAMIWVPCNFDLGLRGVVAFECSALVAGVIFAAVVDGFVDYIFGQQVNWWHIRSLEALASRRMREGIV